MFPFKGISPELLSQCNHNLDDGRNINMLSSFICEWEALKPGISMGLKTYGNADDQALSLSTYYLWRYKSPFQYPWARQYLNSDFLSYEKCQIDRVTEWYKIFEKSSPRDSLSDIRLYSVPLELSASWKTAIDQHGDFSYVGFSALYNSALKPIIGLFERDEAPPQEFMFLRIIDAKADCIHNKKMNDSQKVMIIEEWEYLDSIEIYHDIPFEKQIISKIIDEKLIGDPNIADCLQAPILSSPYIKGFGGGITLSSFTTQTPFAREFAKTMSLMVPPEFRPNRNIIPKSVIKGHSSKLTNGISVRIAERPYPTSDLFSSLAFNNYRSYKKELRIREGHIGEYSICSTLNNPNSDPRSSLKILWSHFPEAVVTLPHNIDNFVEHEIDLFKFQKILNEDIWLQVVHSHQILPRDDDSSLKARNNSLASLRMDFDVQLSDIHEDDDVRNQAIDTLISSENLRRLAQAYARSNDRDVISVDDYYSSKKLILHNFEGFLQYDEVAKTIKGLPAGKIKKRYEVVQSILISQNGLIISELYSQVDTMGLFKNIDDLQEFLDWLYRKGRVYNTPKREYKWIE